MKRGDFLLREGERKVVNKATGERTPNRLEAESLAAFAGEESETFEDSKGQWRENSVAQ